MADDRLWTKLLRNKDAETRTIRVKHESEGSEYFVEVIDTSLTEPRVSLTLFCTQPEAEAGAQEQYQVSLKEGFAPISRN